MANITVNLKIWRQAGPKAKGEFKTYTVETDTDTSFLETLDILNEQLVENHRRARSLRPRLPRGYLRYVLTLYQRTSPRTRYRATTCQLYMRRFHDGETITVEPWRSAAFPL